MGLEDLYREIILDHYSRPRNRGRLEPADIVVEGANPLCGDELALTVRVADGRISEVRFEGRGCSISQASASMMTEELRGKTLEEARALVAAFRAMMQGQPSALDATDLAALQGVRKFPVRVKCATLAWVAIDQGIHEYQQGRQTARATTEGPEG
ncbi:MAG: SUF system NifU family Fe-S cluster assembly protein [Armatimonadota bacterium]|nr:SUF system NifU family Fe-S cluster assembly protein [Armatimonadota bacterium]MDR7448988.1 SUF system NifU family Fe-S cluster assembly protein [Armatimonadota bacterium]MDR7458636.1 SUF system NifU family Fe-S cluster assembly protein [Armatimonadota bacterium]MDR7479545.1 SUF system NifU family Fe-S cluster assembly protein [Armatimonadota bacterium]MDR7489315.1 SUF system NifU family Fe-S cluster assembly protein [Armatimonadota bacterium]